MPPISRDQRGVGATGPTSYDAAVDDGAPGAGTGEDAGPADEPAKRHRIAEGRARVEQQLTSTYERLESARPKSQTIDTAFRAWERDNATGGGVLSAAVAFRVFLFLVPYVFFCVVTFGLASEASSESPTDVARSVGVTGLMARTFASAANLDTWSRVWAIGVSGFAMFLAARALVKVLRITHGLVWRVAVPKLANSNTAAALAIGLVSTQLVVGAGISWIRHQSLLLGILSLVLSTAVVFGLYLFTSLLLPRAECPWWALAPGAAIVAIGLTGLQAATVFYFAGSIERKSDTYGAIGTSLALLLWAYILGRIITAAIALNAAFWYRSEERAGHAVPAPIDLEERLAGGPPEPSS
jgi:uncharacterized BrkB/YihY/UPF0761 family membrane protein